MGALQRLKLALLPAEDAPADPPGSAITGRWTTASAAVSSALSAAAASFAGGRGCQCSRALGPGDTPPIADALTRGWWRERVRRFLPQEAWMRIARCAQPAARAVILSAPPGLIVPEGAVQTLLLARGPGIHAAVAFLLRRAGRLEHRVPLPVWVPGLELGWDAGPPGSQCHPTSPGRPTPPTPWRVALLLFRQPELEAASAG